MVDNAPVGSLRLLIDFPAFAWFLWSQNYLQLSRDAVTDDAGERDTMCLISGLD
jgi:hypothetical protein